MILQRRLFFSVGINDAHRSGWCTAANVARPRHSQRSTPSTCGLCPQRAGPSSAWSVPLHLCAASCFVALALRIDVVALPRCGGSSCRGARASSSPSDLFAASCFVALALRIDVVATALRSSKLPRCTSVVLSFRQRRHSCGLKVPAPRRWSGVGLLGVGATIIGQAGRCRTGGHSSSTQRILERV